MRPLALLGFAGIGLLGLACGKARRNPVGADEAGATGEVVGSTGQASTGEVDTSGSGGASTTGEAMTGSGGNAATGGSVGTGAEIAPEDPRPLNPDRSLPFASEPGWQDSDETFCNPSEGAFGGAFDVWADDRGVFVFTNTPCDITLDSAGPCERTGLALQHNDGTGWRWLWWQADTVTQGQPSQLSGFEGGPLVYSGQVGDEGGFFFFQDGQFELVRPVWLRKFVVAGTGLVYGLVDLDDEVTEYRDGDWETVAVLPNDGAQVLAGVGDTLVVAGDSQVFMRTRASDDLEPVPGAPESNYYYGAAWLFSANDVWISDDAGRLLHFDGSDWSVLETGNTEPITELWGDEGVLYYIKRTEFGRVDTKSSEVTSEVIVAESEGVYFNALWGRSASEVFLTLLYRGASDNFSYFQCGEHFVVWFDGEELHSF